VSESKWTSCPSRSGQVDRVEVDKLSESITKQETRQPSQDNLDLTAKGENAQISTASTNRVFTSESEGQKGLKGSGTDEQPLQTVTDANATASVNPACSAPSLIPQTPKKTEHETHASRIGLDVAATERAKQKMLAAFRANQPTAA